MPTQVLVEIFGANTMPNSLAPTAVSGEQPLSLNVRAQALVGRFAGLLANPNIPPDLRETAIIKSQDLSRPDITPGLLGDAEAIVGWLQKAIEPTTEAAAEPPPRKLSDDERSTLEITLRMAEANGDESGVALLKNMLGIE